MSSWRTTRRGTRYKRITIQEPANRSILPRGRSFLRRQRRSRSGMNDGKRFFKLRSIVSFTTTAGGSYTSTFTDDPSAAGDWSSINTLFDSYRMCAMKIKYVPHLPNDTSTVTGFQPIYMVHDPDDSAVLLSAAAAVQYENLQVKNAYRPWTYYRKFSKQTSNPSAGVVLQGGYRDVAATSATQAVKFWVAGLDISTEYGTFIVTYYIVAKNRR